MSSKSPAKALRDSLICGIDEVGRGPLAGPVVAACVLIKEEYIDDPLWNQVTDSKKLTSKKREALFDPIRERVCYGLAEISPSEIDTLNIHHATLKAMHRAFQTMKATAVKALIDGKFVPPGLPCPAQAVVKGDSKHVQIAAASIIAKVHRDRLMAQLHQEHPHYGWAQNAGYGTAEHLEGIRLHGITPHHRKSFAPVKNSLTKKIHMSSVG